MMKRFRERQATPWLTEFNKQQRGKRSHLWSFIRTLLTIPNAQIPVYIFFRDTITEKFMLLMFNVFEKRRCGINSLRYCVVNEYEAASHIPITVFRCSFPRLIGIIREQLLCLRYRELEPRRSQSKIDCCSPHQLLNRSRMMACQACDAGK